MNGFQLTDVQKDALGEIGNIGAGNATTALAQMTNQHFRLTVPETRLLSLDRLPLVTGVALEEPLVSVYIAFRGDASGCLLLLFTRPQALSLCRILQLPPPPDIFNLSALQKSALGEVGNIVASSYLTALASFTGLRLLPMPPGIAVGMSGAILSSVAAFLGQFESHGLVIHIRVHGGVDDHPLGLQLIMIPQLTSLVTILQALGLPLD